MFSVCPNKASRPIGISGLVNYDQKGLLVIDWAGVTVDDIDYFMRRDNEFYKNYFLMWYK